jgi:hypothetical protein
MAAFGAWIAIFVVAAAGGGAAGKTAGALRATAHFTRRTDRLMNGVRHLRAAYG